jgi:orotate phosphoribosyltransferase
MDDPADGSLLALFQQREALLEGHFLLSSGLHSARYLQCARVLMDPPLASRLAGELALRVRATIGEAPVGAVVAPAMGGIVIGHEMGRALGCRALFTEREGGEVTLRRGFALERGETVVVVEDVVTTGLSTREVVEAVRSRGARPVAAAALVDRSGGRAELGVPLHALMRLDVPTWPAGSCPLCAAGGTPVKPGSR